MSAHKAKFVLNQGMINYMYRHDRSFLEIKVNSDCGIAACAPALFICPHTQNHLNELGA